MCSEKAALRVTANGTNDIDAGDLNFNISSPLGGGRGEESQWWMIHISSGGGLGGL